MANLIPSIIQQTLMGVEMIKEEEDINEIQQTL